MNLILLTHERETHKPSNTGRLVAPVFPQCWTIIWQRKIPDAELLQLIQQGQVALVYPGETSTRLSEAPPYEHYILIDSTWQEARKIFNHSPYLDMLPRIRIDTAGVSEYTLRRNQREGGLCTAECVVELLKISGQEKRAERLRQVLLEAMRNKPGQSFSKALE